MSKIDFENVQEALTRCTTLFLKKKTQPAAPLSSELVVHKLANLSEQQLNAEMVKQGLQNYIIDKTFSKSSLIAILMKWLHETAELSEDEQTSLNFEIRFRDWIEKMYVAERRGSEQNDDQPPLKKMKVSNKTS